MKTSSCNKKPETFSCKCIPALFFLLPGFIILQVLHLIFLNKNNSIDAPTQLNSSHVQHNKKIDRSTIGKMGFVKEILRVGNGLKPQRGQKVTVHCTGFGKNNDLTQKFWSTKDPGQTAFTFAVGLGQVIKGWDESVIDMSIGEIAKIHCSPDYAYGAGGFPAWGIMPNSELIFEIEVLSYA